MKNKDISKEATKAGKWYTIGNILLKGCIFFSLPIFTRILSTSDFGIYNTYMAYEGIITAILGLGLYGTVKNAKLDYKEKFDEYLSSVLSLSMIFLAIILVIINCTYNLYNELLGFDRVIVNCLVLQSFGSYLIYFYGAKLNIEFRYKSYLIISFFNTVGNIGISIFLIKFVFPNARYLGRIIGSALPLIIVGIIISISIILKGKKFISKKYWIYALAIGLPLVPHVISQSLLSQFDRIMITNIVGESESGIYSYICTICTILYVVSSSFDNAWSPWVYMMLKDNKNENIKKASKEYIAFFAILTLGFICVMPEITKIIASKEYWDGIDLLVPISLSNYFTFLYMMPVNIEYYNKKTKYISLGTISAALLNFGLNFLVIGVFGYRAAAYTTLFSYILLFVFHWMIAKKLGIEKSYNIKDFIKISTVLMLIAFSVLFIDILTPLGIIYRYIIVLIIFIILFKYKNKILKILKGR